MTPDLQKLREAVARIIDPRSFQTDATGALRYRDARVAQAAAFNKAERILALDALQQAEARAEKAEGVAFERLRGWNEANKRIRAEIERADHAEARATQVEGERDALLAAAEPFARFAEMWIGPDEDDRDALSPTQGRKILVGWFRALRQALSLEGRSIASGVHELAADGHDGIEAGR